VDAKLTDEVLALVTATAGLTANEIAVSLRASQAEAAQAVRVLQAQGLVRRSPAVAATWSAVGAAGEDGYAPVDAGKDVHGTPWAVSVTVTEKGPGLIVSTGHGDLLFEGAERERYAEAVARAVSPGQVSG
jgi:hypothetical protein